MQVAKTRSGKSIKIILGEEFSSDKIEKLYTNFKPDDWFDAAVVFRVLARELYEFRSEKLALYEAYELHGDYCAKKLKDSGDWDECSERANANDAFSQAAIARTLMDEF